MKPKRRFGRSFILIDWESAKAMQSTGANVYFWSKAYAVIMRSQGVGRFFQYMAQLPDIPIPIDFQNIQEDNGSCQ